MPEEEQKQEKLREQKVDTKKAIFDVGGLVIRRRGAQWNQRKCSSKEM